jgi:hypothetical protein
MLLWLARALAPSVTDAAGAGRFSEAVTDSATERLFGKSNPGARFPRVLARESPNFRQ